MISSKHKDPPDSHMTNRDMGQPAYGYRFISAPDPARIRRCLAFLMLAHDPMCQQGRICCRVKPVQACKKVQLTVCLQG
ncbi:hypothetical protein TNCV_1662601 [Trichonephila clavipes]|nr:hypothetical protein TNCV_1662601 [Trichonephila clavipes]